MTDKEQKIAAREFATKWAELGYEKGDSQKFKRTVNEYVARLFELYQKLTEKN